MPKKYNNKKGFTLIEILVVVVIVGILASILVPTYQKYILKSRASEALNLLEMVKTRQQVAVAKSPTKTYIPNAAELAPLTAGSTETAQGVDLLVNTDYTVTLNSSSQCAIVIYKQGTADEFTFAASYERPGVACVGTVCNSFTSVTTNDIDSVCVLETAQQVAPPPGPVCNKTCPDFAPLNADICACICTNTETLMDEATQSCPEPSCQDDFTGCLGDKVLTPIPTDLCHCACPPTKPIEGENDTCLDCNDACPTNMSFVWSYDRRRCETTCPEGTVLDTATANSSNPQCISCAQETGGEQPFWVANTTITPSEETGLCVVSSGGHCEPCPDDKPIWDGETCISCAELHAYAISRTSGTGGVTSGGTTTGYTYTEIAAYQIKEQATSASTKSGGTKSKTLKEDFDNAEAAFDAAKKALENIKTEISTSEFNAVKKNLDAAAAELEVAKKDNDATKAKAALDVAMKALSDTKSAAVVNDAKADLNSAKSGFDASSATSATMNTNYTQAAAAAVKSPSSGSSNSVYDNLINIYGSGRFWHSGTCKECWEVDITKPEWNGTECVSCIEAHPARVKCSAANTSSNHEYMQMGVSLPTRFNDYITDFRANIDKYALESGALLARQFGVGWIDELGHEMNLQDVERMQQACRNCICGRSGTCGDCYGVQHVSTTINAQTCRENVMGDEGHTCDADCAGCNFQVNSNYPTGGAASIADQDHCASQGQYSPSGYPGSCVCQRQSDGKMRWSCGTHDNMPGNNWGVSSLSFHCTPNPGAGNLSSSTFYVSGEYSCNIIPITRDSGSTSTVTYDPQGSCADTWYGATEYVPAKPIWNSTTHQCEACAQPVSSCTTGNPNQEVNYKLTGGSYWDGVSNTCTSIGTNTSQIGSYTTPKCCFIGGSVTTYALGCSGLGVNGCHTMYYFNSRADIGAYAAQYGGNANQMVNDWGYTCLESGQTCSKTGIDSQVSSMLGVLGTQYSESSTIYSPKDKAYFAVTKLGLSPNINFAQYVVVE